MTKIDPNRTFQTDLSQCPLWKTYQTDERRHSVRVIDQLVVGTERANPIALPYGDHQGNGPGQLDVYGA